MWGNTKGTAAVERYTGYCGYGTVYCHTVLHALHYTVTTVILQYGSTEGSPIGTVDSYVMCTYLDSLHRMSLYLHTYTPRD